MNQGQMALQIQHELEKVKWLVGAKQVVFGTQKGQVPILAGTPTEGQFPIVYPVCIVVLGDGSPDDDEPELIEHSFKLITGVQSGGDPRGEFAVVGGPSRDLGKSPNRGISEVSARVRAAVGNLNGSDGAPIILRSTSIDTPFNVGRLRHVVFDQLTLTALCTSALHYSAPQEFRESGDTWTWAGGDKGGPGHCAGRFDFLDYVIRRVAAPAFPQSPTDGTAVYTGTLARHSESPISEENYGVFARYDGRDDGTSDGNSDPEVVGSTLVGGA